MRLDNLEQNNQVLKQAIGTFADAVSEEIEELQRNLTEEMDSRVNRMEHKIAELSTQQTSREQDQAKLLFEV